MCANQVRNDDVIHGTVVNIPALNCIAIETVINAMLFDYGKYCANNVI